MTRPLLHEVLKARRLAAGLTQKEVAYEMGYSTAQFISNWERGVAHPPMKSLKKVAQVYRISREELFELFLAVEIQAVTQSLKRKFGNL
jgi:transcriptional regulator with XRE-family HTH domain